MHVFNCSSQVLWAGAHPICSLMISSCFLGKFISESEIIRFESSCRHLLILPSKEKQEGNKAFSLLLPLHSAMIQGQIKILALFLFLFVALDSFVSLVISAGNYKLTPFSLA